MIYFAGPDVFAPDPVLRSAELKAVCQDHGAVGVFPLDADPPSCAEPSAAAAAISRANEALIVQHGANRHPVTLEIGG
jgi:nucleoside 2-deoxyribosyltransferase